MPEEGVELPPDGALLTADEIARIVRIAAELGVRKVRLTGGEPLLRRDIVEIVERVASTPGIEETHLTTTGLLLESRAKALTEAGLTGVNVSLDSLDAATYRELTRRDGLEVVLRGLRRAAEAGISTI
ncbi:radical SAM protein, partial [bacterium]|nr:radical SAM protein [bacterium]